MFTAIYASEFRSLRKREGAVVADILNEQTVTPALSNSTLYATFHGLERVSSSSVSTSGSSSSMTGSMTRAMSLLSAKTLSIFQRKRIPEFTPPVVIIQNEVPRIIITPAEDSLLYDPEESMDINSATPASCFADVSQLISEEPLDGMESPTSTSEDGHSSGMSSASSNAQSSGPSTPFQRPQDIPRVKPENRRFMSQTAALWSTRHGRSYCASRKKAVNEVTAKEEVQEDSLDTLESTEIALMFQREHGNTNFVEQYRGRRWAQLEGSEDNWSVDTGSEELASSVEFGTTYTTILRIMTQPTST